MPATLHPSRERLAAFLRDIPEDVPIAILNLLRYRAVAAYASSTGIGTCTGIEAFSTYSRLMMPLLESVGAEVVWVGKTGSALIAPNGETWDEVVLVRFPDKDAFVKMTTQDNYVALAHHRTAALADSRMIALVEGQVQHAANQVSFKVADRF